ncbi:ABC transporter substrate-binding protein [Pelagibacterium luteolum]|uniref:Peptide/nickel transport system substrate-binding protein n=1 Tax=Pelagibacterium luteolum TaxID=440168 RepID=A0A1G7VHG1_9HYPH|nr:ABC transporter substrate-binding protein [Pelagibacterium luteolum]SDG58991.1 peptide/nickel transport system substrate-binding protein [Pelagibacterium luteolum]
MKSWKTLLGSVALAAMASSAAVAQDAVAELPPITEFPREQTLIVHNPENPAANPEWFNIWVAGAGAIQSSGLHQLMMDTLWYIDPNAGLDGSLYNSLASDQWEYNEDFTEMTVRLREGLYWSDGVEFTSADVVYTVETLKSNSAFGAAAGLNRNVESVEAIDDYTVVFHLNEPNSRFHTTFTVRWNATWIMPKHIFEQSEDPTANAFNPPVGLGPYTLHSHDPNGAWYIWEKREDWERTSVAEYGEPGPQYIIYRSIPNIDNRLIEMVNGNLDMIHDLTPEAMFSLVDQDETARGWFPGFPYAHPDPTLPAIIFNNQDELFQDRRVRWALALMLDARQISMASYRGAATLSPIAIPPTGTHLQDYHAPLQEWLIDYELDTGSSVINPYDPDVGLQVAEMVRPQFGDAVPTDESEIRQAFGYGWWGQNLDAAAELLEDAGFTRQGNDWYKPDGERFEFTLKTAETGVINRFGTMAAQQWSQAGVNVTAEVDPVIFGTTLNLGDFEAVTSWTIESWGGDPDLSFFLDSWHSEFIVPPGERQPARNFQRFEHPELDRIIDEMRVTEFGTEENLELGYDFVRLMVDEMPIIPMMSYNVFAAYSERYWTGFPDAVERPYANPVTNWANSRYIFTQLEPTQ